MPCEGCAPGYRSPVEMSEAVDEARVLLGEGAHGRTLWRHTVLQLLDDYESARKHGRDSVSVVRTRPELTGDRRVDAALAGLVEHLALRDGWQPPVWVDEPGRDGGGWLVSGIPAFRRQAEEETPPAFRKHGVLITAGALERA